jgi:hypothetical protein
MSGIDPAESASTAPPDSEAPHEQPGQRWTDPGSWGAGRWAWIAAALGALIYLPSLWNGLAYDDVVIITDNERLQSWSSLGELLLSPYWPVDEGSWLGLWRPTTSFVMFLAWQLGGGAAFVFHLVNVAVHAAVSALVVRVAARVIPVAAAGLAGVVFAVHPVHVEAVANGVGLGELLAALLLLLALLVASREGQGGTRRVLLVCTLYAVAFGAKEGAVVLPGLIFVLDAVRGRLRVGDLASWLKWRGPLLGGLVAVAAVMLFCRSVILDGVASTMTPIGADLLTEIPRIWTLGEIWYQMLRVLAVPTWLSPDYSPELVPILVEWTPRGIAGVLGVLGVLLAGWVGARRMPDVPGGLPSPGRAWSIGLAFGVAWFIVAISPTSNVPFLTGILLAERTLYLPSVGIAIAVGALLAAPLFTRSAVRPMRLATLTLLGFLLVAWTTRTVTYVPAWKDNETLFRYMVENIPESLRSQFFMGDFWLKQDDEARALLHYRVGLERVAPPHGSLMEHVDGFLTRGYYEVAYLYLARALATREDQGTTLALMSIAARESGDLEAAEYWGKRAVEEVPDDGTAWYALGNALAQRGRWAEAADARAREAALDSIAWQPWLAVVDYRARAGDEPGALAAADSVLDRADQPETLHTLDSLMVEVGLPPRR